MNINIADLPYIGTIPKGIGFCKDSNGNVFFDDGEKIAAISAIYDSAASIPPAASFGSGVAQVGSSPSIINNVFCHPDNSADQNTQIIQSALDIGGYIHIDTVSTKNNAGEVLINNTLIIRSNTYLHLAPNVVIKLAPNTNKNIIRNNNWDSVAVSVTSLSCSDGMTVSATIPGHGRKVGDYILIYGVTPWVYNGIHQVVSVADDNNLTYRIAYDAPISESISAGSGVKLPYIQTTNTSANTLTAVSGNTSVTGSLFVTGSEWQGKTLATVINGVITELGVIASVSSSSSLTLQAGASASVTGGKYTVLNPAGMFMMAADCNITLDGGGWDYSGSTQSTPDSINTFGIYLRKISKLNIKNTIVKNATKYAIAVANIYNNSVLENINLNTVSDGIHLLGGGRDIFIKNVNGLAGDDTVAIGHSDYYKYIDQNLAFDDFISVTIENVKPRSGFTAVKYFGAMNLSADEIRISNVGGRYSGGLADVLIINDGGMVIGSEAGGSLVKRISVEASWDQYTGTQAGIVVSGGITVNELTTPEFVAGLGNSSGTSNGLRVQAGGIIKSWNGGIVRFFSASGSYAANAAGIYIDSTSQLQRINISNYVCENIGKCLQQGWTGAAEDSVIVNFGVFDARNCGTFITATGRITVNIGNAIRKGYQNAVAFAFSDFAKISIANAFGLGDTSALTIAAGKNVTIIAPQLGLDPTSLGGGSINGQENTGRPCSTFHNRASAWGTIEQYAQVLFKVSTSKWVQLTDTTKTSP